MKGFVFIITLLLGHFVYGQLKFDSTKVTKNILHCAKSINHITQNENFDSIDSLRKIYSEEIWLKMPFATNLELFELTSYPNKYVRLHAYTLLVEFRDQIDTALLILQKNASDTTEFIDKLTGDLMYTNNVYDKMLKLSLEYWITQRGKNQKGLSNEQLNLFNELSKRRNKKNV